jgi:hypothetical protein
MDLVTEPLETNEDGRVCLETRDVRTLAYGYTRLHRLEIAKDRTFGFGALHSPQAILTMAYQPTRRWRKNVRLSKKVAEEGRTASLVQIFLVDYANDLSCRSEAKL